jgi:C4-type Zn-finger protein
MRLASLLRRFLPERLVDRLVRERATPREDRYFVTIEAQSREQLLRLAELDLDVFPVTARMEGEAVTIEGLLTMPEVERVRERGYVVRIEEEASKRSRAHETAEFEGWLQERQRREKGQ